ncbi:hypothetical protein MAH2_18720 [Sessilibacter sp. MAH2]
MLLQWIENLLLQWIEKLSRPKVIFYGKPTCINNRKQRKILQEAGIEFQEENLLTYPWRKETLISYFVNAPKSQWYNKTAPAIKQGDMTPDSMTEDQLLDAMCLDPVLIRRPLISIDDFKTVGFDWPMLADLLKVDKALAEQLVKPNDDVETCVKV